MKNIVIIISVSSISLLLAGCDFRFWGGGTSQFPISFSSNGERIYYTGQSDSGKVVKASSSGTHSSMHRQMHGGGCASCHGTDREGLRLFPVFWRKTPALTANALFGNEDLSHSDSSDHGHDPYTVQSLRVAITKGINPAGLPLNTEMPRWEMDERDLDDLINYLQQ